MKLNKKLMAAATSIALMAGICGTAMAAPANLSVAADNSLGKEYVARSEFYASAYIANCSTCNLRQSPNTSSTIVTTMQAGDVVGLYDDQKAGTSEWLYVYHYNSGKSGYVKLDYLDGFEPWSI